MKKNDKESMNEIQSDDQLEKFPSLDDIGDYYGKFPDEVITQKQEAEEPAEEEPEPEPTPLQKKIAEIPEKKWLQLQIAAGALLGLLAGLSLTLLNKSSGSSMGLIIAVVIALIIPNTAERQFARKMPKLRIAMIITLVVLMAAFLLYGFVINPGFFETAPEA
ncbi:hypothetical protein LJC42_01110 [Eubacteriales bacterium OttesenSCG-928-K08]|nr:hypothetical protein [Eubacteriales bacterium OttesenSCG-928-K08]